MSATPSAGAVVHAYLSKQVAALHHYRLPALRGEDDAVHQMRVATRRLRSLLSAYGRLYAECPLSRRRLRWLAGVLGEVRDLEVLRMRFTRILVEAGAKRNPKWLKRIAKRERRAYVALERALERPRFTRLMAAADALSAVPKFTAEAKRPAAEVLEPIVDEVKADLDAALAAETAAEGDEERDSARHEARKAAKRARYVAEAAAVGLSGASAVAEEAKRLQDRLGRYQDTVVAIAYLRESGAARRRSGEIVLDHELRRRSKALADLP
jgi:CHAD domain-containing protein